MNIEPRLLGIDRADMVRLVRDTIAANGDIWLRIPGRSMLPAIPSGAIVRLRALQRPVWSGDVVLWVRGDGVPKLHRVVWTDGVSLITRGDGLKTDDPLLPLDAVLAIADRMTVAGSERAIPSRWLGHVFRIAEAVRSRLRRLIGSER